MSTLKIPMFKFSKTMEPDSRRTPKTPEAYFAGWISWFNSRGIKTEIQHSHKGASLWREGTEATERISRKTKGR